MNSNALTQAREENKRIIREGLIQYLEAKGIECGDLKKPKLFKCISGSHPDKHPSMNIWRTAEGKLIVKCHQCGWKGDTLDVISKIENENDFNTCYNIGCDFFHLDAGTKYKVVNQAFDFNDAIGGSETVIKAPQSTAHDAKKDLPVNNKSSDKKATESATEEKQQAKEDFIEYYKNCFLNLRRLQDSDKELYKKITRGISDDTINEYKIGYDPQHNNHEGDAAIIIPHTIDSYNIRRIDEERAKKYNLKKYQKKNNSLFNSKALNENIIFVTEGEFDALSIIDAGYNALAICSTNNYNLLLQALDKLPEAQRAQKDIILNLDNDDAGRAAAITIMQELDNRRILYNIMQLGSEYKDANEVILKGEKSLLKEKCKEAVDNRPRALEYKESNNTSKKLKDFFKTIEQNKVPEPIPTGYKNLDKVLDGGLLAGIYTIGAESSLGKTTFALQMVDQIAKQGHDALIFSLEMPVTSLIAKSISRLTYINAPDKPLNDELGKSEQAKTLLDIKQSNRYYDYSPDEKYLIQKAKKIYSEYTDHIYIFEKTENFNVLEVEKRIVNHINFTGNIPVVLIDYLQLLEPIDTKRSYTDKQLIEQNIKFLVKLWKKHKTPIILISSMNRGSYSEQVAFSSLKESGLIEYSSDVVLGLQFDIFHDKNLSLISTKGDKEEYIKELAEYERTKFVRDIELKVLKNRESQTGDIIKYNYVPAYNYFYEGNIVERGEKPKPVIKSKAGKNKKEPNDKALSWEDPIEYIEEQPKRKKKF